jgi:hypothetical protein
LIAREDILAEDVLKFTTLRVEVTPRLCVLIDLARTLETVATFMNVE